MSAERTILRTAIDNAELVNRLGDRAVVVLEDAARAVAAQLLTAKGPATIMALQAQLASIRDTFRAAGIKTYSQFVDDLAYQLSTFEGRSEAVIRAVVGDAVEAGSQALASGTVGPAAGVAVGTIGAGATPAAVLQTVATMGPLEITVLAAQQEYSLGREFARALLTPTNGVMRQEVEAQAARLSDLFEKRVRSAVVTGQTNQELVKQLMGDGREITGDAAMPIRSARTLVRTGVQQVANAVNHSTIMANPAVAKVEFIATLDGRTSAICRAMSGRIFDKDKAPRPPLHFNCVTPDTLVAPCGRVAAVFSRWYEGPLYILRTANGSAAKLTPNHPVLTSRGWQPAKLLKVGDRVFQPRIQGEAIGNPQDQQMMAAEDLAAAFRKSPSVFSVTVPVTAKDFHGDGEGTCTRRLDPKVGVVDVDRMLAAELNSPLLKLISNPVFSDAAAALPGLRDSQAGIQGEWLAPYGSVSRLNEPFPFRRISAGHAGDLLRGATTMRNAFLVEESLDGTYRDAELLDNASEADATGVEIHGGSLLAGTQLDSPAKADLRLWKLGQKPGLLQPASADPEGLSADGDVLALSPEGFELVELVSCERDTFAGHVFNFETELATYVAGNLLTHNCRSILAAYRPGGDHGHRSMTMGVVQEDGSVKYLPAYGDRDGFTGAQMRLIKQNNQGYAVDYRDWLSAQPKAVQVDILGAKRQAIFQKTGSLVLSSAPSEQKAIKAAGYSDGRRMPLRVRAS